MSEKDPAELRRRLRKLGRSKRSKKKSKPRKAVEPLSLPEGEELETPFGSAFRIENTYEIHHQHGNSTLSNILSYPGSLAADVTRQPAFNDISMDKIAFLDTETTGLGGGAGTIIFLVGIGAFVENKFRFRQYFLRDPSEEAGMLELLQEDLESASGFVTYNGRSFDLPILESRYTIALRRKLVLASSPHLDLLHVARRLWRHSLPDCTLGTVEGAILGVGRTDDDVPGALIPGMYLNYLRSGDASEMTRVIYHNTVDVLSLVGLAGYVLDRHTNAKLDELNEYEALAVARWHQDSGRSDPAESAFRKAVRSKDKNLQIEAIRRYTIHLKREKRKSDAVERWVKWHALAQDDPTPCIELAKYYEWDAQNFERAQHWTQEALQSLTHWPSDWRRDRLWGEVEHRLTRLKKKIDGGIDKKSK